MFVFGINFLNKYISVTQKYLSGINFENSTYSFVIQIITLETLFGNYF